MTPTDVQRVLAYASAVDPRVRRNDPDERTLQVAAWHTQLAPYGIADARVAVDRHYALPDPPALLPGRLRALIAGIREERLRTTLEPVPAADPDDPGAYIAALRSGRAHVAAHGTAAVAEAPASLGLL